MEKYKKTAGLNYLRENSYKGDGSPGMVMGIASDARGDTNTNEAQKPTTNSKHSGERDLKQYDPAHGHTKPEGGKPGVCSCITSSGPSTDCAKCGGTGEEITKKRNDPQVDEALEAIKKLSGLDVREVEEEKNAVLEKEAWDSPTRRSVVGCDQDQSLYIFINNDRFTLGKTTQEISLNLGFLDEKGLIDVNDMFFSSSMDFATECGFADDEDAVRLFQGGMKLFGKPFKYTFEADGSGSYGGQSPLTYDTQRSSKMKEDDDELNEIARLSGLEEVKRKKRPDLDDLDDEDENEKPEDPDADKVGHILMQLKKADDVDGDHPIKFLNGEKHKLPLEDIKLFIEKYMDMKPLDREKMQEVAVMSKEKFDTILSFFQPKHGKPEKSIYEDDEMLSESQFDEAAGEKDACYHKVKSRYKVWPSAYASGALVKCRKAGASNWGEGGKKK